jgi:hypothetical protein
MSTRWELTIDCAGPAKLAAFWALALGYEPEPPPDGYDSWEAWCVALAIPEDEWDEGASISDPTGERPRIYFQQVPEGKLAKNRLHLDLRVGGPPGDPHAERWARIAAAADRLVAAGASVVGQEDLRGLPHHLVLADPEGNEFCLA